MRLPLALLLMLCAAPVFPQSAGLPASETLTYRVEWRLITAGRAKLEWSSLPRTPQPDWQVKLHLESVGLVSKLFKVDDEYTAILGQNLCALSSQTIMREGSRQRDTRITFNYADRKASYLERDRVKNSSASQETDIPACTHDVIGGLYLLRTLNLDVGQSTQVPVSDGKKSVMARVEAQQREQIKVPDGQYNTIRYELFLFDNVLYRRSAHLYVWLTDDRRKLPVQVRVKMQITTGTITFELEKHE